jgi:hypothetical protein
MPILLNKKKYFMVQSHFAITLNCLYVNNNESTPKYFYNMLKKGITC